MKQFHASLSLLLARVMSMLTASALVGCVFVPRTSHVYDEECQTHARHMTLEPEAIQGLLHCSNQNCTAMLVTAGVVTAASMVISGSIVIVGNVAYWLEKQERCKG